MQLRVTMTIDTHITGRGETKIIIIINNNANIRCHGNQSLNYIIMCVHNNNNNYSTIVTLIELTIQSILATGTASVVLPPCLHVVNNV